MQSPDGQHYTGRPLTLSCFTSLDSEVVDLPVEVTHNWSGPNGVVRSENRISLSGVFRTQENYQSILLFDSLLSSDSGVYTCSSVVQADTSSAFIASSTTTMTLIDVDAGKME